MFSEDGEIGKERHYSRFLKNSITVLFNFGSPQYESEALMLARRIGFNQPL